MITLNSFKNNLAVFSEFLASTSSHQHITTMKINQLPTTLLAMAPSTALLAILTSGIPEEHAPAVKKAVGALCSKAQESDKPYVVSLGNDSFYCDKTSTGLVANAVIAGIDESLMPSCRKNQLRVKG